MVLPNDIDLLNPPAELEKRKHKLKRLVQSPNSFFMVAFPFSRLSNCVLLFVSFVIYNPFSACECRMSSASFNITTVFSHSQTVVVCGNCQTVLCQPTGGRARLTEGCSFLNIVADG
ncbi:40S ribosomal protein S27-2 [Striga hermonthica]|uniref:40S ribosomal protein S27-2 n=1 Tax=Striga hermonthica TaxID=68872 RepID=A0A9N7P2C9_STRHE|nr:40S ribosomal protein S27-2 [Striga hermonthica]